MLRVRSAIPLEGRGLRLTLTDGTSIERDISDLMWGPVFDRLRTDDALFRRVRARYGTVTWPGNLDIAPETLIWDGPDPATDDPPPKRFLRPGSPHRFPGDQEDDATVGVLEPSDNGRTRCSP